MTSSLILISRLLAFALILQGIEYIQLLKKDTVFKVWSSFSLSSFKITVFIHLIAALIALISPQGISFFILFITHLLICIRFRGSFNGGSDMMIFVVLTGVLVGLLGSTPNIQKLGLIYISIHLGYSYFKAGLAKIRHKEWRNGTALTHFSKMSLYSDIQTIKIAPSLGRFLCYGVLIFELGILILLVYPQWVTYYFGIALAFHFLVYLTFGLNRFFWVWLSAWPALIFTMESF